MCNLRNKILEDYRIAPGWNEFFSACLSMLLPVLDSVPDTGICPKRPDIFRVFSLEPARIRVIILGQDPYPTPGAATGRAFEIGNLRSWSDPFRQISMKNILRSIGKVYLGDLLPWKDLLREIEEDRFSLLPPDRLFASWQDQGVFLLNTALTCLEGVSASHLNLWKPFADELIEYLVSACPDASWFLWGRSAISALEGKSVIAFPSRHPMLSGGPWDDDFFRNPCFEATRDIIDWRGIE